MNIHLGIDRTISKNVLTGFWHNLTFQVLSKGNVEVFSSFENIGNLVLDILESFSKLQQQLVQNSKILGKNLKQELDKTELLFELEIQENLAKYHKKGKTSNASSSFKFLFFKN